MPGTRSSARQAAKGTADQQPTQDKSSSGAAGTKRKASATSGSQPKKGKKEVEKGQTTIEETLDPERVTEDNVETTDVDMKGEEHPRNGETTVNPNDTEEIHEESDKKTEPTETSDTKAQDEQPKDVDATKSENIDIEMKDRDDGKAKIITDQKIATEIDEFADQEVGATKNDDTQGRSESNSTKPNGFEKLMDQDSKEKEQQSRNVTAEGTGSKATAAEDAVETSSKREEATPSSILEKGVIYFFFRGRVGVDEPTKTADIARSYIVLRPLPHGAKLGEGPIGDEKKNRMLALPKKVLPKSPKDRFMVFVEKANVSLDDIRESLSSSDYTTQTAGARHTPAATPIGEGVYAITRTGRDTHLAYILTIPAELDAVQNDIGLRQRGSYFTSAKNPESNSPANASLPQGAKYPKDIIDEFHGRGWMPLEPKLLDYENTQFLIIGHGDNALEKAAEPQGEDEKKPETVAPLEEVEKLEHEDELRVQHLDGDDSIFTDLGLSSKEYPKVQTTW